MSRAQVVERELVEGADIAPTKGEVAIFAPPRLPYHDAFKERFGVERMQWKALVEACYPNAKTIDSVAMVLSYCKARNLDPFKRPVHIVPMWSRTGGDEGRQGDEGAAARERVHGACEETGAEEEREIVHAPGWAAERR